MNDLIAYMVSNLFSLWIRSFFSKGKNIGAKELDAMVRDMDCQMQQSALKLNRS